jgi:hypothetical protein
MSTLHTSCSVSVDPQQQALFAIQCPDITPRTESCRSKRIESMSHMLVQLAGARSLPEASATSYTRPVAPKQVRKYNCFSRWMNHPPRTMRLEWPPRAPRPPNPLKPTPRSRLTRRGLPSTVRRISSLHQAKLCDGILSRVNSPLGERWCMGTWWNFRQPL